MSDLGVNWQALRTPNIFSSFTEGLDQGQQAKRQ